MPSLVVSPGCLIAGPLSFAGWSGVNVFDRGGTSITLATWGDGEGRYADGIDALNGRGSQSGRDLQADGQVSWTATVGGASNFQVYLNDEDRFVIRGQGDTFEVNDGEAYGIPNGTASSLILGWNTVIAPDEWDRNIVNAQMLIDTGSSGSFNLPSVAYHAQQPIVMIRPWGLADLDDVVDVQSLEWADNEAADNASRRIRWMITDNGHVQVIRPTGVAAAITWVSTTFRDYLGFDGTETEVTSVGCEVLTASRPLSAHLKPTRPLDMITPEPMHAGEGVELMDGDMAGNTLATFYDHLVELWLDGPGDSRDLHRHFTRRVLPHIGPGRPVTVYQEWPGEIRRRHFGHDVTVDRDAYSVLYTVQENGDRGRIRGHIPRTQWAIRWARGRLMRRAALAMKIRERADE